MDLGGLGRHLDLFVKTSINIIGWDNGGGLSRDIDILRESLAGEDVVIYVNERLQRSGQGGLAVRLLRSLRRTGLGRFIIQRVLRCPKFDINVHLEDVRAEALWLARRNILIPNHECFSSQSCRYLVKVDEVWAKTKIAEQIFSNLGCEVRFLGWTSVDRRASRDGRSLLTALHIAGASTAKGTEAVLDVWGRNPGWPLLRVLRRKRDYAGNSLPWRERSMSQNILIIAERIGEHELLRMQNESALCICPSEAEGFGHVVLESLSAGGIVVTTDAPPMNELITAESGLLVRVDITKPMGLDRCYFVDLNDLEKRIRIALEMTDEQRARMGRAARARFETIDRAFRLRVKECLKTVLERPLHE